MLIANPMYDTIFKHLMEDLGIAKGFLSQVLGRKIHELSFREREHSRYVPENEKVKERVKLFRLDFVAEIDTEDGRGKVMIELQKTNEHDEAYRFRAYIGRAYTEEKEELERRLKDEQRAAKKENRKPRPVAAPEVLPIIPIVILGFKLDPNVPSDEDRMICHVKRRATNPNADYAELDVRYQLAECLSHDLILIQVPYIPEEPKTDLELILSIFEQRFFYQDEWRKDYPHHLPPGHPLEPLLRDILHKLHVITEDAKVAEQIRDEEEAELHYMNLVASLDELEAHKQAIREQTRAFQEQTKALREKDQALQEKDQALQEKDQAIREQKRAMERAMAHLTGQGMPEAQARSLLGLAEG